MRPAAPPSQEDLDASANHESISCFRRGLAAAKRGDDERAAQDFQRAYELAPDGERAWRAQAFAQSLSVLAFERKDKAAARRAVALWQEAAAALRSVDASRAWFYIGLTMKDPLGDLPGAIEAYGRALACQPAWEPWSVYFQLGNALEEAGRFDEAADSHRLGMARYPKEIGASHLRSARYNLGNALRSGGRFEEAVAAYESALAITPPLDERERRDDGDRLDTSILVNLASAWRELGDRAKERACLLKAIASDNSGDEAGSAWNNLGNLLGDEDDDAGAIACYRRALACARHENPGDSWYNMGVQFLGQGNRRDALACFHQALADPAFEKRIWALAEIGCLLSSLRQWRGGLRVLEIVVERLDELKWPSKALLAAARCLHALGRHDEAKARYAEAIAAPDGFDRGGACFLLGCLRLKLEEYDGALDALRQALAIFRDDGMTLGARYAEERIAEAEERLGS